MDNHTWSSFINHLEKETKQPVLVPILKKTTFSTISGDQIYISCENLGMQFLLEKRKFEIEQYLSVFTGKMLKIVLSVKEKKSTKNIKTSPLLKFEAEIRDIYRISGLQKHFSFENFAVSSSNQIAFAAASAISQADAPVFNPLFIYGGVGVGKTHLLQALGNKILEKNPSQKILYCSSEDFTNDLIEAIRAKNTYLFRKKYRNLNILLLDDIQFIAGKNSVQEEFFHTFNTLIKNGGRVVLSSDQPPKAIKKLEDRLRSRFSGGLNIDIQKPDFELRTAILLIKAKERNIILDIEAAKLIAEKIEDTRELEGKLLEIFSRLGLKTDEITSQVVSKQFDVKNRDLKNKINTSDIIRIVCSYYDIKPSLIKNPTRKENITLPRQVVMYILRTLLKLKLEEIGFLLKRKDHTTIMHGVNKITSLILKNPNIKNDIDKITSLLSLST